jgi:cytidylate kinase
LVKELGEAMTTKKAELPALIISGLPVSGKSTLANMLADDLGLKIYSMGQLWRERWKREHSDGGVSFEEYWRGTSIEDNRRVNMEAKKLFESGTVIVDTRYVAYLNRERCMFVFVTAPLEIRAERAATYRDDYRGKSLGEIKDILRKREDDEAKMGNVLFGADYRDPKLYHVVLNSEMLTPDEEFMIVQTLKKMRRKAPAVNLARGSP